MEKKLKVLFLLIGFSISVAFLVDFSNVLSRLRDMPSKTVVSAACLYFVFFLINAKVLVLLLRAMSYRVALPDCLGINQVSSLFNYIAPFRVGQLAVKATLMRVMFNVSLSASAAGFFIVSLLSMLSSIVLFLISAFYLENSYFWDGYSEPVLLFVALLAVVVGAVWGAVRLFGVHEKIRKMVRAISSFSLSLVSLCVALLLVQVLISALITLVFLEGVGVHVDFVTALFLSSVGNIALLVSVTPGNLGAKELTFMGIGMLLGVPESSMLAALIVDRILQLVISAALSVGLLYKHRALVSKALKARREEP